MEVCPVRLGIRLSPPTLLLLYREGPSHKERVCKMPINGLGKSTLVRNITSILRAKHLRYLGAVPPHRIDKMLRIIQETLRGSSLESALHTVSEEFSISPEKDLNIADDKQLSRIKEIMNDSFEKNRVGPEDPGYNYDIEVNFDDPVEKSPWDSD